MTPDPHALAAILILEKLLEHGSWYSSAIELSRYDPHIDGEKLGDEVEAIIDAFRKEYPEKP